VGCYNFHSNQLELNFVKSDFGAVAHFLHRVLLWIYYLSVYFTKE
jgi:hypothetical protein